MRIKGRSTYRLPSFLSTELFLPLRTIGYLVATNIFSFGCVCYGKDVMAAVKIIFSGTKRDPKKKTKKKLNSVAFNPQANYTDRATAACRRS
jgi:hypothetical protein